MNNSRLESLQRIANHVEKRSIFITGASGFVGRSLLRLLTHLKRNHSLNIFVAAQYRHMSPCAEASIIDQHIIASIGDAIEVASAPDIIFHCATPASAILNVQYPRKMLETNIQAMDWLLNNYSLLSNTPTFVFASSGAVYGSQPEDLAYIPEGWNGAPNPLAPGVAYAEGKRIAEFLLSEAGRRGDVHPVVARLFAFSGVGLPIDRHFAVGNFVRDAITSQKIVIRGDGKTLRSYLDSEDMAIWLLASALVKAPNFPLHIGSSRAISMSSLAETIAHTFGEKLKTSISIEILNQVSSTDGPKLYVPANEQSMKYLGVEEFTTLQSSLLQMYASLTS